MQRKVDEKEILALSRKFLAKYLKRVPEARCHEDDLLSEAMLGVWRAYETYDPEKGAFSTYAFQWAMAKCIRFLKQHGTAVRGKDMSAFVDSIDAIEETENGADFLDKHLISVGEVQEKDSLSAVLELKARDIKLLRAKALELELKEYPHVPGKRACTELVYLFCAEEYTLTRLSREEGMSGTAINVRLERGIRFFRKAAKCKELLTLAPAFERVYLAEYKSEEKLQELPKPYRKPIQLSLF